MRSVEKERKRGRIPTKFITQATALLVEVWEKSGRTFVVNGGDKMCMKAA
jgi:hypothetical protein